MTLIAYIYTDLNEKFGVPRQSGLVKELKGTIVFEPEYRSMDAVKGLEEFNYIWLLWEFEGVKRKEFSATVRPPRLGGNTHMGVFATRSPFRPNPIGLSSVHLDRIEETANGPVLHVSGIDMRNRTPVYDINPYLPYVDCHVDATNGFAGRVKDDTMEVNFPENLLQKVPVEKREALLELLRQDPRPAYHHDEHREYGMLYADFNIRFVVKDEQIVVVDVSSGETM